MIGSGSDTAFPGKLGSEFRKLWAAIRAQRIQTAPGMRIEQTTNGTALHLKAPGSVAAEEMAVVREFDDYLECEPVSGGGTVYVLKPRSLRASAWADGYDFSAVPDYNPKGFSRALIYVSQYYRYRLKFSMSTVAWLDPYNVPNGATIEQLQTNNYDGTTSLYSTTNKFGPQYTYVREQIYPPYTVAGADLRGNNTEDIGYLLAMPLKTSPAALTAGELADDGTLAPVGERITHIDLNNDSRKWEEINKTWRMDVMIRGDRATSGSGTKPRKRTLNCGDTQVSDQVFGNATPRFIASFVGALSDNSESE